MEDDTPPWSKKRIYKEMKDGNTEIHTLNGEVVLDPGAGAP
jgi:hypothetical protein